MHLRAELALADGFQGVSAEVLPELGQFHPRLGGEIVRHHHHAHHQVVQQDIEHHSVVLMQVHPHLVVLAVLAREDCPEVGAVHHQQGLVHPQLASVDDHGRVSVPLHPPVLEETLEVALFEVDDHLRGFLVGLMRQLQHVPLVRFSLAREEVDEEFPIGHLRQLYLVFAVDIVLLDLAVSLVEALQQSEEGNFAVIPVDFLQVVDELGVGLEIPRDERRMDVDSLSLTGVDNPV